MRPFYAPGEPPKSAYKREQYNPTALAKLDILTDIVYAAAYGYAQNRLPTPGAAFAEGEVEMRCEQVAQGWAHEARVQGGKSKDGTPMRRGFDPRHELEPLQQQYLAERLRDLPQTERPWAHTAYYYNADGFGG